ncbi:pyridoxamine 5'-phosphate oxidase family protein [Saccharomonospora piscinae]|uniref:pyridoxamine 5'-phosphate oxidase family protein n=1 Tax=Saccharomonospora piscinae TaxID=687388 RepID=UPI001FDA2B68|nr:pyridoxamine 5'-phosphate oxidase family protein [Saccharomonospora piscinae]
MGGLTHHPHGGKFLDPQENVDLDCGRGFTIARMERPTFDLLGFLDEPYRAASVATTTESGEAALAMMWFLLEDGRFWFNSPQTEGQPAPLLQAAREGLHVAVMVATFNPPHDVRQTRVVGPARLEERDISLVRHIYGRYVPTWTPSWEAHAASAKFHLWSVRPDRGMAVTYPDLADQPVFRWSTHQTFLSL